MRFLSYFNPFFFLFLCFSLFFSDPSEFNFSFLRACVKEID